MKILKHLASQPFVVATGFAALIHSTWSLGTFFSGLQPADTWQFIMWLIPALLIAFSLDIGQIVTSAEIRAGQRSRAKYATFAVFAIATYFLQFVYMASHMPQIELAPGIRPEWTVFIGFIRDAGVFVIPALLPLSTLLYTFSQSKAPVVETAVSSTALALVERPAGERIIIEDPAGKVEIECDHPGCSWAGSYTGQRGATNALTAHKRKHSVRQGVEQ